MPVVTMGETTQRRRALPRVAVRVSASLRAAVLFAVVVALVCLVAPSIAGATGPTGFVPIVTYAEPDNVPGPLACSGTFCMQLAFGGEETDNSEWPVLTGVLTSVDAGATWASEGVPAGLRWLVDHPGPFLGNAMTLRCISSTTCLAAQNSTVARTTDGGAIWTVVRGASPKWTTLDTVLACTPGGSCLDATSNLEGTSNSLTLLAPGASAFHRIPDPVAHDSYAQAIACATAARCVLTAEDDGGAVTDTYVTTDLGSGTRWVEAPRMPGRDVEDLACPTTSRCVGVELVGTYQHGRPPRVVLAQSRDGGVHWTTTQAVAASDEAAAPMPTGAAVACATALDCAVVVAPLDVQGGDATATAWSTTSSGAGWTAQQLGDFGPDPMPQISSSASCLSRAVAPGPAPCLLDVGNAGDFGGLLVASSFNDDFHSLSPPPAATSASSLDCTTDTTCWRIDQFLRGSSPGTRLEVSHDDGTTWSTVGVPSGVVPELIGGCQSAAVCEVLGVQDASLYGNQLGVAEFVQDRVMLLSTVDGGTTWTTTSVPGSGLTPLTASCTSSTACVVLQQAAAPDGYSSQSTDELEATTDGATWAMYALPDELDSMAGASLGWGWAGTLSCSTGGTCLFTAGGPSVLRSTNGGLSWGFLPYSASSVSQVVCFTGTTCDALMEESPNGLAQTTDGGQTWTNHSLPSGINGETPLVLACSDPSTCTLAQAGYDGAPSIDDAVTTGDAGATWSTLSWGSTAPPGSDMPGNLTCSATTCLVEDLFTQTPQYQLLRYSP